MEENIWFSLAATYYRLADLEMARESLDHSLTTNPNHINSLLLKWIIAVIGGDNSQAFAAANKLARIGNDNTDAILMEIESTIVGQEMDHPKRALNVASLIDGKEKDFVEFEYIYNLIGFLYQQGGLLQRADSLFRYKMEYNMERILRGDDSYKYPYEIAEIHNVNGNEDKAISWLGQAVAKGWLEFDYALKDPLLASLRENAQFRELIGRAKHNLDSIRSHLQVNPQTQLP